MFNTLLFAKRNNKTPILKPLASRPFRVREMSNFSVPFPLVDIYNVQKLILWNTGNYTHRFHRMSMILDY